MNAIYSSVAKKNRIALSRDTQICAFLTFCLKSVKLLNPVLFTEKKTDLMGKQHECQRPNYLLHYAVVSLGEAGALNFDRILRF